MSPFTRLVRFTNPDGAVYFADLGKELLEPPPKGSRIPAFKSLSDLLEKEGQETVLLAPVPREDLPIYCVGLNYKSHANEAGLQITKIPPLWTKPASSLANPAQDIVLNQYCATSLPDYEGELVFITSAPCKDVTPAQAAKLILGYTLGNDLSCRLFQLPTQQGGQFFYAKAFDDFAPIGPTLISPEVFESIRDEKMITRVNGKVRQSADLKNDMVFDPATVLSYMSQGTTIPAHTMVMTGTAAGVGAFMTPKTFLNDGDVVEIVLPGIGELRNKIVFHLGIGGRFYLLLQRLVVSVVTRW